MKRCMWKWRSEFSDFCIPHCSQGEGRNPIVKGSVQKYLNCEKLEGGTDSSRDPKNPRIWVAEEDLAQQFGCQEGFKVPPCTKVHVFDLRGGKKYATKVGLASPSEILLVVEHDLPYLEMLLFSRVCTPVLLYTCPSRGMQGDIVLPWGSRGQQGFEGESP